MMLTFFYAETSFMLKHLLVDRALFSRSYLGKFGFYFACHSGIILDEIGKGEKWVRSGVGILLYMFLGRDIMLREHLAISHECEAIFEKVGPLG